MYSRQSLELLKQSIDPKDVLITVGGISASKITDDGDEIRCPCPLHGGDNKTSFAWRRSKGTWNCFSHGCGDGHSHDLYGFVSAKLNINFVNAAEMLSRQFGFPLEKGGSTNTSNTYLISNNTIKEHSRLEKYKVDNLKELGSLPGYREEGFDYMLEYITSRGYNYDEVKQFYLYPSVDFLDTLRMGIPVYDEDNRLVGINARLMDTILEYPKEIEYEGKVYPVPKYRMTKFQKGSILYNLNNARKFSVKEGLTVVEGQLDVLRLHTYGIENAVCTMGTALTSQQLSLVYKHCFHLKFLIEEGDAACQGVLKSINQLKGGMKVSVARLPSGDADSNSREVVLETLRGAKELRISELNEIRNLKVSEISKISAGEVMSLW